MSKKTKSTSGPSKAALPHINAAMSNLTGTVNANAPQLQANADAVNSVIPGLTQRVNEGNPMTRAAQGYNQDVLGGRYLNGNPHLESIINSARGNTADGVNAQFARSGRTAGGAHQGILGQKMFEAEAGLRYGDYNSERDRMGQAAALTPGLVASELAPMEALLAAAQTGSEIPYIGAKTLAQGTQGLWGNATTTTQKNGLGSTLAGLAGAGLSGWASGGFSKPKGW